MNKLLVLGNGFDLACGVKSSYKSYFSSDYYSEYKAAVKALEQSQTSKEMDEAQKKLSCWDILFVFLEDFSEENSFLWCDIETIMHQTLVGTNQETDFVNKFLKQPSYWDNVYSYLFKCESNVKNLTGTIGGEACFRTVLKYFCKRKWVFQDKIEFYHRLLEELRKFEVRFGDYIRTQTSNEEYESKSRGLLSILVGRQNTIKQVDCFNYSSPSKIKSEKINHVNGDFDNPIFGINLIDNKKYYLAQFTKTSRRILQDVNQISALETEWSLVNEVMVFGHSLDDQDFDYFVYLFTRLGFNSMDISQMKSIVFCYTVYDENKAEEIRENFANAVYHLIGKYEELISVKNQNVLLNLLRFSGVLKIREITINSEILQKENEHILADKTQQAYNMFYN